MLDSLSALAQQRHIYHELVRKSEQNQENSLIISCSNCGIMVNGP
jgi:uncharacterized Zn finger protein